MNQDMSQYKPTEKAKKIMISEKKRELTDIIKLRMASNGTSP